MSRERRAAASRIGQVERTNSLGSHKCLIGNSALAAVPVSPLSCFDYCGKFNEKSFREIGEHS